MNTAHKARTLSVRELIDQASFLVEDCEETGEDIVERFVALEGEIADKLEALFYVHRRLYAEASNLKDEADRLKARSRARLNEAARVKNYGTTLLLAYRDLTGDSKIRTERLTSSLRKTQAVEVAPHDSGLADDRLPDEFYAVRMVETVSKTLLKIALQEGRRISGAELVTNHHITWR